MVVYVHSRDRPLQRGIGFLAEGGASVQPRHVEGGPMQMFQRAPGGFGHMSGIWYTRCWGNGLFRVVADMLRQPIGHRRENPTSRTQFPQGRVSWTTRRVKVNQPREKMSVPQSGRSMS